MGTASVRTRRRARKPAGAKPAPFPPAALPAVLIAVAAMAILLVGVTAYRAADDGRVAGGVRASDVDLGGLTDNEARRLLLANAEPLLRSAVTLKADGRAWTFARRDLGLNVEVDQSVDAAMAVGRTGSPIDRIVGRLGVLETKPTIPSTTIGVDGRRTRAVLGRIAAEVDRPAVEASIDLRAGQGATVTEPREGRRLDVTGSERAVHAALLDRSATTVPLVVDSVPPKGSANQVAALRARLQQMLSAPLTLKLGNRTWTLSKADIAALAVTEPFGDRGQTTVAVDEARLDVLVGRIAHEVNQPSANARFDLVGNAPRLISPGHDGQQLDVVATTKAIESHLTTNQRVVELPVRSVKAALGPGDADRLGALAPIASADTTYGDTIANRRFNVEFAASRLNGAVILPNQVFSLNDALGEVTYRSGYKQAYGITQSSEGVETIPSEGGGICQVATTLFHAVFWAGYPVVERNWHLYWIPRYGLAPKGLKGLDATIDQIYDKNYQLRYSVDFKFRNNTDQPLLIQAHTDGNRIQVSLYGRKPSWVVKVRGPIIANVVKANPTPIRQPTNTLEPGHTLMIEEAEDGFTSTIVRDVYQGGKLVDTQTFRSVYQPSRNVWLVGATRSASELVNSAIPADRPANLTLNGE